MSKQSEKAKAMTPEERKAFAEKMNAARAAKRAGSSVAAAGSTVVVDTKTKPTPKPKAKPSKPASEQKAPPEEKSDFDRYYEGDMS